MTTPATQSAIRIPAELWSIVDHGFANGAVFIVSVVLGRVLTPSAYGAFGIAYAAMVGTTVLNTAYVSEPLLVFGAGRYRDQFPAYCRVLNRLHWAITSAAAAALVMLGAAFIGTGSQPLGRAFIGAGLAVPWYGLGILARRAYYARGQVRSAAGAAAAAFVLTIGTLAFLVAAHWLDSSTAFITLLLPGMVAGGLLWLQIGLARKTEISDSFRAAVEADHRAYGRWATVATGLTWLAGNGLYFVLPLYGGLAASATLRATSNLISPFLQINAALGVLLVPRLAATHDIPQFSATLKQMVRGIVAMSALCWMLLLLTGPWVMRNVYGGQYGEARVMLALLGAMPLCEGMAYALGSALRALDRPVQVARAYAISNATVLTAGCIAAIRWGPTAAAAGLVASSVTTALLLLTAYKREVATR